MGLFDSFKRSEAPVTAPTEVEPEESNEVAVEAVEITPEVKATPEAVVETPNTSLAWAETKQANLKRTTDLFTKVNNYFREQKEAQGSGKWNKESAHYKAWKESTLQIKASEWLTEESTKLDSSKAELAAFGEKPEVLLAGSGASMAEKTASLEASMGYDKKVAEINEEIAWRASRVEDLEMGYNERELTIVKLEAEMDGRYEGKEQNLFSIAEKAYQKLIAAEDVLYGLKKNFLGRFLKRFKSTEEKTAEADLKAAEASVKEIDSLVDDAGILRGHTGAKTQLANMSSRNNAYNRTMASVGKGTMTKS